MLFTILLSTFLASIFSLLLVALLLLHKSFIKKISFSLVSFAAGALLATGFMETLREAVKLMGDSAFLWTTIAIAVFFVIERMFVFLHHHEDLEEKEKLRMPASFLLFGDGLHNFIDGASIAASFLVSFPLGLITTLAVFIHEIPHELGDFGILIHKGWGRDRVLSFNIATGLTAFLGAIIAFYLGSQFENTVSLLLAITSGNFIYLAATDLLPEIHHQSKENKRSNFSYCFFFILGILLIAALIQLLG